jgi:hypothetical protein
LLLDWLNYSTKESFPQGEYFVHSLAGLALWNGVFATLIPRIATDNPFEPEPAPLDYSKAVNGFVCVLRAGWLESAVTLWKEFFHRPMVKRESFLVNFD